MEEEVLGASASPKPALLRFAHRSPQAVSAHAGDGQARGPAFASWQEVEDVFAEAFDVPPERERPVVAKPKIRLIINDAHVALVLRVKREMCVGEEVRAA